MRYVEKRGEERREHKVNKDTLELAGHTDLVRLWLAAAAVGDSGGEAGGIRAS